MTLRAWLCWVFCVGIMAAAFLSAQSPPPSAPAPLFEVGRNYIIAWDCAPDYLAQAVSQGMAGGRPLNPCYAEEVTVQAVRPDGWVVVTVGGYTWTVNPARMLGLQPVQAATRAAR